MIKTAVILTVFNRREVTLKGLRTLYRAIEYLQEERPDEGYEFDINMTDDGCTDGTADAVRKEFPKVQIIQGNGNLYWSGGMRKAWQTAIDSNEKYEFYLWFNDDAELYENALEVMFDSYANSDKSSIISGAFCDKDGNASYGGRDRKSNILTPNNELLPIYLMNGNLVLIPTTVVEGVGIIDKVFTHSFGDWDYGCRAIENGYGVFLSAQYVGETERHDNDIEPFLNPKYTLGKRMSLLYSKKHSAIKSFIFCKRHFGFLKALRVIAIQNIYAILPKLYDIRRCIK